MHKVRNLALAALFTAVLAGSATAQSDVEPAPPPGGYNAAKLGEALKKLGYDALPQADSPDAYLVSITGANTTLYTRVSLSSDRTNLWLRTIVLELPEIAKMNQEAIRRLLLENDNIGPARFSYSEAEKTIRISRHYPNRDMTPVKLRKAIEEFDALTRKAEPLWRRDNFVRLGTVPADVAKKELDRLQGDWAMVELWNLQSRVPDDQLKKLGGSARFDGSKLTVTYGGKSDVETIVVDPRGVPGRMDLINATGRVTTALYKLENDTLTIYFTNAVGGDRPTDPEMKPGANVMKFVLKRTAKP